jgi:hypothetical protein
MNRKEVFGQDKGWILNMRWSGQADQNTDFFAIISVFGKV